MTTTRTTTTTSVQTEPPSDPRVLAVQEWLNVTYAGRPGYNTITENGRTGWSTMYALTRALQIELGIATPSDSFGTGTLSALSALGGDFGIGTPTPQNQNIVLIIQGGLYCKGYNPGGYDSVYGEGTATAVKAMKIDMGFPTTTTGTVSPKVFKGLLTMNAYVLLAQGNSGIRSVQQWLNARYLGRANFFVGPCDGLFSRDMQKAMIYGIQYEIGMTDAVANGNYGPGTQQGIRDYGVKQEGDVDGSRKMIQLFQGALRCNGYGVPFDGTFSGATSALTVAFQQFVMLPTTGTSDYQTWSSLLVSTGDPTRPGQAADCVTMVNDVRAQVLKSNGYLTVGRYLTTVQGSSLDKKIQPYELAAIFGAGLTIFPIFQEAGSAVENFSYTQGVAAAKKAHAAASGYGFRSGTVIYFAVDFDATQDQIEQAVVPHFEGIRDGLGSLGGRTYKVGVYGARNTCRQVSDRSLASFSFVSGMSTGYSGNLGYALPGNWAFDQIQTTTVGTGSSTIEIDKNIRSGRDEGASSVDVTPPVPGVNDALFAFLYWLQIQATTYVTNTQSEVPVSRLVAQYMRSETYNDSAWDIVAGAIEQAWLDYVAAQLTAQGVTPVKQYTTTSGEGEPITIDTAHLFATLDTVLRRGIPTGSTVPWVCDVGGWAGDLITTLGDYANHALPGETTYAFGLRAIGATGDDAFSFPRDDLIQDVDGFNIAAFHLNDPTGSLADHVKQVLTSGVLPGETRYQSFVRVRFANSVNLLRSAVRGAFTFAGGTDDAVMFVALRAGLLAAYTTEGAPVAVGQFTTEQLEGLGDAFVTVVTETQP